MRFEREAREAQQSALARQMLDQDERAFAAKAATFQFVLREATAEGVPPEVAQERAREAGEAAFNAAQVDLAKQRAEEAAFEERLAQRRAAAAEAAATTAPKLRGD